MAECLIPRRLMCKLPHTTMHACPLRNPIPIWLAIFKFHTTKRVTPDYFFSISHFFEVKSEKKVMKNLKQRKNSGHHALLPVGPVCLNSP